MSECKKKTTGFDGEAHALHESTFLKSACPYCNSENTNMYDTIKEGNKYIEIYYCASCEQHFQSVYEIKFMGNISIYGVKL